MRVVGTAGHVDHGKSTLVAALTGTHPDRLKEEQEREMTIELGFAWLDLPGGEQIGIVDVPGHRDFIENMLAGVGGIDAAIFVVAADEGVMPQTREHLAILDILQIPGGVIALTKTDLVDDPEWLEMMEADIRAVVQGTVLANAPVVRVSARQKTGLEELKQTLAVLLASSPARPDLGRPRLPVDRVFSVAGFGTVVTGTLLDGELQLGQEVELLPGGLRGRVRGLQTHKQKEKTARPGSRTAVNISGVDVGQARRGDVLVTPGKYIPTRRLDTYFRLLPDASAPLRHGAEVKFFLGAAEVMARARLLSQEELKPGEEGWLQLELTDPATAERGDRYILRRPSPGETLGGGAVVDAHPARRHKRFDRVVLERLGSLRQGSPADVLLQVALAAGLAPLREMVSGAHLTAEQAQSALAELFANGQLIQIEAGPVSPQTDVLAAPLGGWKTISQRALSEVEAFHRAYPLRPGMPREELKSRLKLTARAFNAAVRKWVEEGSFSEDRSLLWKSGHNVVFTAEQQAQIKHLLEQFARAPYSTPSVKECQSEVGEDLFGALLEQGALIAVSGEVVFRAEDYRALREVVNAHFLREATLTVGQLRDQLNTSRKYILAFLEHLDALGITQRDGDARRLRKPIQPLTG